MTLCEQIIAQIKQKDGEAWAIQTDITDEWLIQWKLLMHWPSPCSAGLPFDFRWMHF